jgi:L-fuconolactonase
LIIVDTHSHVIAADPKRYPLDPLGGHQSEWSRERPVDCSQMLASMDDAGVDKSVLVQASTCYGHDNSYVADCVAAHPDRFVGVFSVDVLAEDACDKITHWLELGLSGLRLFTKGSTMAVQADWLDDPRSCAAWQMASDSGTAVCVQMSSKATPQLIQMSERFPQAKILLDHLARPVLEDGPPYSAAATLWELAGHSNIYLKVTPRTFVEAQVGEASPESFFPKLVNEFGASRLLWGSNYPASEGTLAELLTMARVGLATLSEEDRTWIFGKTAEMVYPRLAGK